MPNSSRERSLIDIENFFSILRTSFDKLVSKSPLSSMSVIEPQTWQKMWWWCLSRVFNSTTMVFSGVVNSDTNPKFVRSLIPRYRVD